MLTAPVSTMAVSVADSAERKGGRSGVPTVTLPSATSTSTRRSSWMRTENTVDRKSTRLNSSHSQISYAVFCLKKKKSDSWTASNLAGPRHRYTLHWTRCKPPAERSQYPARTTMPVLDLVHHLLKHANGLAQSV